LSPLHEPHAANAGHFKRDFDWLKRPQNTPFIALIEARLVYFAKRPVRLSESVLINKQMHTADAAQAATDAGPCPAIPVRMGNDFSLRQVYLKNISGELRAALVCRNVYRVIGAVESLWMGRLVKGPMKYLAMLVTEPYGLVHNEIALHRALHSPSRGNDAA
jgi:hypothetical protein